MRKRELNMISLFTKVTPDTTDSGKQFEFHAFFVSDCKESMFLIFKF